MSDSPSLNVTRDEEEAVEAGTGLSPKFDANGLIVAVVTEVGTGEALMVAHMNSEALTRTVATGQVWFWSRSRGNLWRKGETSGNFLDLLEMRVDCDQDAILLKVRVRGDGVACHRGYKSCFYRRIPIGIPASGDVELVFDVANHRP